MQLTSTGLPYLTSRSITPNVYLAEEAVLAPSPLARFEFLLRNNHAIARWFNEMRFGDGADAVEQDGQNQDGAATLKPFTVKLIPGPELAALYPDDV